MSSFQIDLTPGLKPDIAVLSNLTPDHLDRHGSMENYAAIKQRLLNQVPKDGQAMVGVDTPWRGHFHRNFRATASMPARSR